MSGLGKTERKRLSEIVRSTKATISIQEAAKILKVSNIVAAKMLSLWTKKGWMSRIKRGLYAYVSLESFSTNVLLESPWIIAEKLFNPCYIGGWTAAEYWDLTEQIFNSIVVFTITNPRKREAVIKSTKYILRTIKKEAMFGLKTVWEGQVKVRISDPTRTILDILSAPKFGGGIRSTNDILQHYLKSENRNISLLIEYANELGNGSVYKRLGFLLECFNPEESSLIESCKERITKGNVNLDPSLNAGKLITRWRLWIPNSWERGYSNDK